MQVMIQEIQHAAFMKQFVDFTIKSNYFSALWCNECLCLDTSAAAQHRDQTYQRL